MPRRGAGGYSLANSQATLGRLLKSERSEETSETSTEQDGRLHDEAPK